MFKFDTLIGLGSGGVNIVSMMKQKHSSQNRKYFKIAPGLVNADDREFDLFTAKEPEEYELTPPDFSSFLKSIKKDENVLVVLCGGGLSSNAAAVLFETIERAKISVLYVEPDLAFATKKQKLMHRVAFNITQEWARSGKLERIYLVSNMVIEKILGGVPIIGYNDIINEVIIETIGMIETLSRLKPVVNRVDELPEGARITTFGLVDKNTLKESCLFPLDHATDRVYYYAINETSLKTDKKLLEQIRNNIIVKKDETGTRVSYSIYATDYDVDYVYVALHTSIIQHYDLGTTRNAGVLQRKN